MIFHRRGPGQVVVFGKLVDFSTSLKGEGFGGGGHRRWIMVESSRVRGQGCVSKVCECLI